MTVLVAGVVLLAIVWLVVRAWLPVSQPLPPAPAGWKSLGSDGARVMVREYGDFQCPACQAFHDAILPRLINDYIEPGRVRFEYHHFIIFAGDLSLRAAEASECAGEQGQFWAYHDLLFTSAPAPGVDRFSVQHVEALAAQLGLDTAAFNTCLETSRYHQRVIDEQIAANQLGLPGTPAVFVNGERVANPFNYAQLQAAIEAALGEAGGSP